MRRLTAVLLVLAFLSAARVNIDSNRSPLMPASTSNTPTMPTRSRSQPGSHAVPATLSTAGATTSPPTAPSMDFFGLRSGAS